MNISGFITNENCIFTIYYFDKNALSIWKVNLTPFFLFNVTNFCVVVFIGNDDWLISVLNVG